MGATSDNYAIVTSGTTYTIASDFVKPVGAGETAHHQIVKVAFGANDTVNYVSSSAPLPVNIQGGWTTYNFVNGIYSTVSTTVVGNVNALTVAGVSGGTAIGVTFGSVAIASVGGTVSTRTLAGGNASGGTAGDYLAVQGISGGFPVGITVSSAIPVSGSFGINGSVAVYGVSGATAIGVTVGTISIRGLTAASDTVTVYGGGTASTVSVGLFGFTGATAAPLYAEGNALNVNVKTFSGGISGVTVTASNLSIRNLSYTTDTATIVGQGAADDASLATVPTYVNARLANGTLARVGGITGAGWSGAAINTYLVNSGFSFTASVTLGTAVGISQEYNNPIRVAGSTYAVTGLWVAGDTSNGPVTVKGYSGGLLPVELQSSTLVTESNFNTKIAQLKTNSDFLIATKKALYDPSVSVGALDFNDSLSLYSLIKGAVNTQLQSLANTVNTSTGTIGVAVEAYSMQPSFLARTNYVGNVAKNLTEYNGNAGFTCGTGVRIKVSRLGTGTNANQNEFMCIISEADAGTYGATAGNYSYTMYHGDELFLEIDNINKIKVFYPAYSASFAPHNTGSGITFSFYAS